LEARSSVLGLEAVKQDLEELYFSAIGGKFSLLLFDYRGGSKLTVGIIFVDTLSLLYKT
jgi:hypothetical protein